MISGRDTPPDIQQGKFGYEPNEVGYFKEASDKETLTDEVAQRLARESYDASTSWINSSRRMAWDNALKAFQSLHPGGSKYNSGSYQHRSTLYRPKSRAMVRRDEAATAAAFFANEDVVSIQAADDDDPRQKASAELIQALLQFRLTKTIPWFLTIVGARQDAEVLGICAAKAYWKYEEVVDRTEKRFRLDEDTGLLATNDDGSLASEDVDVMRKLHDKPCVDLIAPENIRIEPGADWRDPVNSSPYVIESVPLYLGEVMRRIESGEWLKVSPNSLRSSTDLEDDPTRRTREWGRQPGKDSDTAKPTDYSICWVRDNIIRWGGQDWQYFTVGGTAELLSRPKPIEEVYLHGVRPYVIGSVVLEAHKTFPSGKIELVRDLQRATNDDWNLRFDNLKLNLNPRQFVKVGDATDLNDVRTFVPGKTVLVKNPRESIVWDRPPPPGAEAYAEQDRINLDFDELTGAFSNSSVQASQLTQQSATGMHLMSGEASGMVEYELRCFSETFVEPLIRLLVKLEQAYETDPVVLALAGKQSQLRTKYGIDEITDELLDQEVMTRVNVGIGATNPNMKLRNFLMGADALGKMFGPSLLQGVNFEEVEKEVFGLLGYKDGARFFKPDFDPRVAQLQQQLQEMQKKQGAAAPPDQSRVQVAMLQAQSKEKELQLQAQAKTQELQMQAQSDAAAAQASYQKVLLEQQAENWRTMFTAQKQLEAAGVPQFADATQGFAQLIPLIHQLGQALGQMHQQGVAMHQHNAAMHAQTLAQMQGLGGAVENATKRMGAGRRVVRDENGRVSGVELAE